MFPKPKVRPGEQCELVLEYEPRYFRIGSSPACPDMFVTLWCPQDGMTVQRRLRCSDERRCAICSKKWAYHEGLVAAHRIRESRYYLEPRHVIVSPDPLAWPATRPRVLEDLRAAARVVLKKMGFEGGATVVHLERHTKGESPVRWFWGPHIHVLGYGKVNEEARPQGWYVEAVRDAQDTLEGTVAYLVDHAHTSVRGHALTWFGSLSYNKLLGVRALPRSEGPLCPLCGGVMVEVQEGPELDYLYAALEQRRGQG